MHQQQLSKRESTRRYVGKDKQQDDLVTTLPAGSGSPNRLSAPKKDVSAETR